MTVRRGCRRAWRLSESCRRNGDALQGRPICAVAHQPPTFHKLLPRENRRQTMLYRERNDVLVYVRVGTDGAV